MELLSRRRSRAAISSIKMIKKWEWGDDGHGENQWGQGQGRGETPSSPRQGGSEAGTPLKSSHIEHSNAKVTHVETIHNVQLWKKYMESKDHMKEEHAAAGVVSDRGSVLGHGLAHPFQAKCGPVSGSLWKEHSCETIPSLNDDPNCNCSRSTKNRGYS